MRRISDETGTENGGEEALSPAPRDQELLEGSIGDGTWRYRTARIPGYVDFIRGADEDPQEIRVGGPIIDVQPLRGKDDREVLILTERSETLVRRNDDDEWVAEGTRPRQ